MSGGLFQLVVLDVRNNFYRETERNKREAARKIQKAYNLYRFRKQRDNAARIIQKGCENWLYKPILNDGRPGIVPRLAMINDPGII